MTERIIEAEAVEVGTEIVPATEANLFRKDDPVEALTEASRVATALADVVKRGGMIDQVSGKDYVKVEGWRTLGAILGVSPQEVEMVEIANGWQCTVEAVTADGRVVGRATSSCTREEGRWSKAKTFELQGMASTRATSRALRGPLGFVMQLAGFQATSAEEMSEVRDEDVQEFQDDVLPEGQRFPGYVHVAKWIERKKDGKSILLLEVAVKPSNEGALPAREKVWIDPLRPEFTDACDHLNGGTLIGVGDDVTPWEGRPVDIEITINGKWRNHKLLPGTEV